MSKYLKTEHIAKINQAHADIIKGYMRSALDHGFNEPSAERPVPEFGRDPESDSESEYRIQMSLVEMSAHGNVRVIS